MKTIKFTPENLKRHLRAHRRVIFTTRDKVIGSIGDVFKIEGAGYFVLSDCTHYKPDRRHRLIEERWREEGFESKDAFEDELFRIYPSPRDLYVFELIEVFLTEDEE